MINLNGVNNLLIIRLSSLGDILLTTAFIRSLKEQYPSINIDFLLRQQYEDTLKYSPHLRKLYVVRDNYEEIAETISQNKYDLIIDLQNNLRSHKLSAKNKAKKLRFKKHDIEKFLLVKFKFNRMKDLPQIPVRYSQTLNGFHLDDKGLEISLPEGIKSKLKKDGNYIALAPGSRHFTKMWPEYYYIYLCKMLLVNDFKVVFSEEKVIKKSVKKFQNFCRKQLISAMMTIFYRPSADMKKCMAVVCNDSGLMHAACAAGVPVLTFFGSTVKEFGFTPYNNKNLILENNSLSCRPCSHIGRSECPKTHFDCMKEITPQIAFKNINLLINS